MSDTVVVVGAGYAGAGAVRSFERVAPADADLIWISEHDYHLVLHEVHRVIRNPSVASKIRLPVEEIKSPSTTFVEARVEGVDADARAVELADGSTVDYDYLLVALGSATAFYGIEGLRAHSLTLKSLADARAVHDAITEAAASATRDDPAQVLVGGAGLSGIQAAGEIAGWRDDHRAPLEVTLVEGLDDVFPGNDPSIQRALRERLEAADVEILTGDFISEVDERRVYLGGGEESDPDELPYDVLLWTGGITGQSEIADAGVEKDERSNRLHADRDFRTSDDRVFALGDTALVRQDGDDFAPPTAQAAWQAATVAGENLARAVRGDPLAEWTYEERGTLVSVGESAVAHDVRLPVVGDLPVDTFGGPTAKFLKKTVACRWIRDVASTGRAVAAWSDM